MRSFGRFVDELKRRRVIRALVVWGVVAFAVLQVIEPLMHGLELPSWTLRLVVVLLALGFPVVAAFAWTFDLTREGLARTPDAAEHAGAEAGRLHPTLLLLALGMAAAAPGLFYFFVWPAPGRSSAAAVSAPAAGMAPSIAVLPFVNMSSDREQEYFSDGISEEILNALSQVEGLVVIGRTSSFALKGKSEDLRTVGQRLGAAHLLEGSVRKAGTRVRITAQLIEASRGAHLWSQQYDRELTDVFAVQEEIARAVVGALKVKLLPAARSTPAVAPDDHDALLRGRALIQRGSVEANQEAAQVLRAVTERSPGYAPAWVSLSRAIFFVADQGRTSDQRAEVAAALAAADRGVDLAPSLADAYLARSQIRQNGYQDWPGAQADTERARILAPGDPAVLARHGNLLLVSGRIAEATAAYEEAARLDPLAANTLVSLAIIHMAAGRLPEAEEAAARGLALAPESGRAARTLGFALLLQGKHEPAREAFRRSTVELYVLMGDVLVGHALGREGEARQALERILAQPDVDRGAYQVAELWAWLGETDRAFEWLDRSMKAHDAGLQYVKTDPLLRPLRADPRFPALLARLKLPAG